MLLRLEKLHWKSCTCSQLKLGLSDSSKLLENSPGQEDRTLLSECRFLCTIDAYCQGDFYSSVMPDLISSLLTLNTNRGTGTIQNISPPASQPHRSLNFPEVYELATCLSVLLPDNLWTTQTSHSLQLFTLFLR